jgi:hypothetical protein
MATDAQEFEVMCAQWGLTEDKKGMLSFLIAAQQIDTLDAYLYCEHYHWNMEQIQEHMFDESYAEEWKKKREDRAAEAERRGKGDDDEVFLLAAKIEEPKREILVQCKCGSEMIVTTPRESYPDFNNVARCDLCATLISGDDFIYYCSKGRSPDHKHGYDLCVPCAHKKFPKAAKQPLRLATAMDIAARPPKLAPTTSMLEVPQIVVGHALKAHRSAMLDMLHLSIGSDVKFIVGEEKTEFNAHSLFLSIASPDYWGEKLMGDDKKTDGVRVIELPTVAPAAFQCILNYAYGSHPKVSPLTVVETRYLATLYGMDALVEACENYFDISVDDGICDVLTGIAILEKNTDSSDDCEGKEALTELLQECKDRCRETLELSSKDDVSKLLKSGGFKRMTIEAMIDFVSQDVLPVDEDVLWRAVVDWAEKQAQRGRLILKMGDLDEEKCDVSMSGMKEDYLLKVKGHIRFGLMPETFWMYSVKKFLDSRVSKEILSVAEIATVEGYFKDKSKGCGAFSTKARGAS